MGELNSLATGIGWFVIIGFVLYFVSKVIDSNNEQKLKKLEEEINIKFIAYRISLRHIYHGSNDAEIREEVKSWAMSPASGVGGWAMLELDMADTEFQANHANFGSSMYYLMAQNRIQASGYPMYVDGNKIKVRW